MAKQRHGRHHPHECLAVKGKDRQEEDGAGMKMEGMEIIMAEDNIEEIRERGDYPREDAMPEEGMGGTARGPP